MFQMFTATVGGVAMALGAANTQAVNAVTRQPST
jgi:hypothetical protein